ncbi:MAG: F0F1 ATP synthase subunit gamma [Candidatus Saccharimonadales bacterium]
MKRPLEIAHREMDMATIANLTGVFETLASMKISQVKNQVLEAQQFFAELWSMYRQIRVDSLFRFGREQDHPEVDKQLYIVITSEGGFSGDIDQKLITWMLEQYDAEKQDIVVVGHHGAIQLSQQGVKYQKYFKLPAQDQNINVLPLVKYIRKYRQSTVFYETYVSLMVQDIKKIELQKAVQDAGSKVVKGEEIIDESTYIFEPSNFAVVAHLESSMIEISLSQAILESKLAQYASRFRSMSSAKEKAVETRKDLHLEFNRTKRAVADERLKEMINGMKKARMS